MWAEVCLHANQFSNMVRQYLIAPYFLKKVLITWHKLRCYKCSLFYKWTIGIMCLTVRVQFLCHTLQVEVSVSTTPCSEWPHTGIIFAISLQRNCVHVCLSVCACVLLMLHLEYPCNVVTLWIYCRIFIKKNSFHNLYNLRILNLYKTSV